jgi:hypothetical protein
MNDITLLRESGPEAPALSFQTRSAARAALLDEIEASRTVRGRLRTRLPSRRAGVRIVAGVSVAAVAWGAAVVIAAPDPVGSPASTVTLVDFDTPTFPLSLDPVPDGLRPAFEGDGTGSSGADYRDASGQNGFVIGVHQDEPDLEEINSFYDVEETREVTVDGTDGQLLRGSHPESCEDGLSVCGTRHFTQLAWEHRDDQWVLLTGDGRYDSPQRLMAVAESVVDRPQPATLSMGLAPAGWSVQFFKMGRILTLVNDSYEQQTLSVNIPLPEDVLPPEQFPTGLMGPIGPVIPVTVNDRPAHLIQLDSGYLDQKIWFLQAQFEDGTVYELQVPDAFTQEQVVEFAEQVTYNP